jgi:TRAP-type mannitol/chloroaromatic compound transport system permease small subunit
MDIAKIEAKLFSKIIFLDYRLNEKLIDGKVIVHIIYDDLKNRKIAIAKILEKIFF